MKKLSLAMKSRTIWTLVALFVVNGVGAIHGFIPESVMPCVDLALALMVSYFHLNPSQNYNG